MKVSSLADVLRYMKQSNFVLPLLQLYHNMQIWFHHPLSDSLTYHLFSVYIENAKFDTLNKNSNVFLFLAKNIMPCNSTEDLPFSNKFCLRSYYFLKRNKLDLFVEAMLTLYIVKSKLVFYCKNKNRWYLITLINKNYTLSFYNLGHKYSTTLF